MQEQNRNDDQKHKPDTVAAGTEQGAKQKTEPLSSGHGQLDKREGSLDHGELGGDLKKEEHAE